jgi:hypothetical protein
MWRTDGSLQASSEDIFRDLGGRLTGGPVLLIYVAAFNMPAEKLGTAVQSTGVN